MPASIFKQDATLQAAPLWRRLAAIVYDSILMIAIWFVTTMVYMLIKGVYMLIKGLIIGLDATQKIAESEATTSDLFLTLSLLAVTFLFFAYFWQKLGQTLGMQVWRIRVQTSEGTGIGWQQCFIRFFGAIISAAALGTGYLWMLVDKRRMTWHDKLSDSCVVFVPVEKSKGSE